jgi:anti-anti-sigma regulatory factor
MSSSLCLAPSLEGIDLHLVGDLDRSSAAGLLDVVDVAVRHGVAVLTVHVDCPGAQVHAAFADALRQGHQRCRAAGGRLQLGVVHPELRLALAECSAAPTGRRPAASRDGVRRGALVAVAEEPS